MKVTAVGTSGGFNVYSLEEVEPVLTTYGYQTKTGGFTTSYAAEVNNATVAVDTVVFARFRSVHSTVGDTWEFVSSSSTAPTVGIIAPSVLMPTTPQVVVPANSQSIIQCTMHVRGLAPYFAGVVNAWFYLFGGAGTPYGTSNASYAFSTSPPGWMPFIVPLVSTFHVINAGGSPIALVGTCDPGWGIDFFSGVYTTQPYP